MRTTPKSLNLAGVAAVLAVLVACGGGPTSPSSQEGVVLRGRVVGATGAAPLGGASAQSAGASAVLTVRVVENTAMTATVAADGSFTMRGLPPGGFTLEFMLDGVSIGTVRFDEVKPNQEITITVAVADNTVTVLEEKRDGIGHGDVEIQGTLTAILELVPSGDSRFTIDGRTVVARPGQTAIRQGNTARTVADLVVGQQVHVKGVWLDPQGSQQSVLAHEIKLQGGVEEPAPSASCIISGGRAGDRIELEGTINSGGAASFLLLVQGNRASAPVQVEAGGATFECTPASGPNAPTPAQCQASVREGAKVHVSGTLTACDTAAALVAATRVRVQK